MNRIPRGKPERLLLCAATVTAAIAVLHIGIILGGPDWYRFFGAGERMARLAARGSVYPTVVTTVIAVMLGLSSLYALSGARMIRPLPFRRLALMLLAVVFLVRGLAGIPLVLLVDDPYLLQLRPRMTFMIVTSLISTALGLCYAIGAASKPSPEQR